MQLFSQNPVDVVIHLAGQVAVTTSVKNPREDFEINALGTFNILEAVRTLRLNPVIINASTNKVYGALESIRIEKGEQGYSFVDHPTGVSEDFPLDFHSPYGCSKGVADQYVRDYHRIYGLNTFTIRQSCIYGCHQFGIEDQGWVAWFVISMLQDKPITIYGDGLQVRDLLFVDDLVDAYLLIAQGNERRKERVLNIGGGPENATSVISLLNRIARILGKEEAYGYSDWRPGDQKVYVSNNGKIGKTLGWTPRIGIEEGISRLIDWLKNHRAGIEALNTNPEGR